MDHNITVSGYYFELRPVRLDDAGFMISLRTDPELATYLNPTSDRLEDQQAYLENYFSRPDDYYFIVQDKASGSPEGMLAIYDIDQRTQGAEWGRWILRKNSLAAVESACLVYRAGLEQLGLKELYCRTVARNERVISFHASCGLARARDLPAYVNIDGVSHDSVEQVMDSSSWQSCRQRLEEKARQIAILLNR
ncbi:MAG: GNAT family N-acetyltransferase [Thiogranum sp.]